MNETGPNVWALVAAVVGAAIQYLWQRGKPVTPTVPPQPGVTPAPAVPTPIVLPTVGNPVVAGILGTLSYVLNHPLLGPVVIAEVQAYVNKLAGRVLPPDETPPAAPPAPPAAS